MFRGEANVMTWVHRISADHCLDVLRGRRSGDEPLGVREPLEEVRAAPHVRRLNAAEDE
jgi:DNA-directed RNA polymerase specialized sigma24 family protein